MVNLGTFAYPQTGTGEATLSWTGAATSATTVLDLDVSVVNHDGRPVPRGAASLTTSRLTLTRGGTAAATPPRRPSGSTARRWPPGRALPRHRHRPHRRSQAGDDHPGELLRRAAQLRPDDPDEAAAGPEGGRGELDQPDGHQPHRPGDLPRRWGGTPGDTFTLRVPAGRYAVLGSSVAYYVDSDVLETTLAGEADLDMGGARA
ncbi:hypothetical protein NKG94_06160 [Micromonospora sp. M12]